jgi:hypothetical protein
MTIRKYWIVSRDILYLLELDLFYFIFRKLIIQVEYQNVEQMLLDLPFVHTLLKVKLFNSRNIC